MSTSLHTPFGSARKSDAELIRTYRSSKDRCTENHAFGLLVDRYDRRAISYARSLVGTELAEEAVRAAWAKTVEPLRGDFDETRSFKPWFFRIVRNTAFSELRKWGRRSSMLEVGSLAGPDELSTDWGIRSSEWASWVASCSPLLERVRAEAQRRLSPGEWSVFQLRLFEGLPYAEVAARLGSKPETARQQMKRARDKLRPLLRSWWDAGGGP